MKRTINLLFIIINLNLIIRCTDRERLNPIDPQNPETAGRPQGLRIYSEYDRAVLQWRHLNLNGIEGYRIYRKQASDSAFIPKALASLDSNQYVDYGLAYNKKYDYYITVIGEDFETPSSDTVSIIPGPTIIWATDVYNRRILKISHDGAHEIKQIPVEGYPWAIAYDNEKDALWYTDVFLNRVYRTDSQIYKIVLDIPDSDPIDLAMDRNNNQIWIADQIQGKIYMFDRLGAPKGENGDFKEPVSIDCDLSDGSCWVADSKAKTVTKISNTFNPTVQIHDLIKPTSVSVNQKSGDCWVADSLRVLKFDATGRQILALEPQCNFLRYLTVDPEIGYCWVLDFSYSVDQSHLLCYNNDGDQLLVFTGLNQPENLKANPYDHSCIVADSGANRILKISLNGTIIGQVNGYNYLIGLFIEL